MTKETKLETKLEKESEEQRLWHYRGFMIFKPKGNPINYPYRIGDTNYVSIAKAKREIDKTWEDVGKEARNNNEKVNL